MENSKIERIVFQPATYKGIQQGINQIVNVIRPTLGPQPRIVAIEPEVGKNKQPELLDSGGLIARRIIEIKNRDADVGAMLIRQMLWRLHERIGDGTATAAVMFQTIFDEGIRYIVAGGNAPRVRYYLEKGLRVIDNELAGMVEPIEGKRKLGQIAQTVCYDPPLAKMMGEIFDIIGEHGRLELRTGKGRELEREYIEGIYFDQSILSREMITDPVKMRAELENPAILLTDLPIEEPHALVRPLLLAVKEGFRSMLIVTPRLSEKVMGFLHMNNKADKVQVIGVKIPGAGTDQGNNLKDMGMLTGANPFIKAAGDTFDNMQIEDLGQARRVWADRHNFGIVGGKGDTRKLREHIALLRAAYDRADDPAAREKLQQRIGRLMGGSAVLWVGGTTESELEARKELAKRTAGAMRGAVRGGILPGGGVAMLNCRPAIQKLLEQSTNTDERAAYRILLKALETPVRTIIANAGYDASDIMAEIRQAGSGHTFDVLTKQVVDVAEAGLVDVAAVQREAVRCAISSAALALTVDVMVHHKKPQQAGKP
jgi:chaperonin GroEL